MYWEIVEGNKVTYWSIYKTGFTAGSHYGSGHSDAAIHYDINKILNPLEAHYLCAWHLPPNVTFKEILDLFLQIFKKDYDQNPNDEDLEAIIRIEAFIEHLEGHLKEGKALADAAVASYKQQEISKTPKIAVRPTSGLLLTAIESYEDLWENKIETEKKGANRAAILEELAYHKTLFVELVLGLSQTEDENLRMWQYRRLSVIKTKGRILKIVAEQKIQNHQNSVLEAIWKEIIYQKGRFEWERWEEAFLLWQQSKPLFSTKNGFLKKTSALLNGEVRLIHTILQEIPYENFESYWANMMASKLLEVALQNFYTHQFDEKEYNEQTLSLELPLWSNYEPEQSFEVHEISAVDVQQLLIGMIKVKKGSASNIELYSLSEEKIIPCSFFSFYAEKAGKVDTALAFFEYFSKIAPQPKFYWVKVDFSLGYDELGNVLFSSDCNALCLVAYSALKQSILLVNGSD